MKTFKNFLGPEATKEQDRKELVRQKLHLAKQAKEYHDQSEREGGGRAAKAKGDSFLAAMNNIHNEETSIQEDGGAAGVGGGMTVAAIAGSGDSRLPASQREPGVSKKRNPVLKGLARRLLPKV